jgi:hypothetical protein
MRREFRILLEITGDVIVVLILVVIASIGAGWCRDVFTPGLELYLGWFGLWSTPIYWYAKWRGVWDDSPPGLGLTLLLNLGILQILTLCGLQWQAAWQLAAAGAFSHLVTTAVVSRIYPENSQEMTDVAPLS